MVNLSHGIELTFTNTHMNLIIIHPISFYVLANFCNKMYSTQPGCSLILMDMIK